MSNDKKRLGIKQWSEEDRPREKLFSKGAKALTNAELLAILIGSGTRSLSAVDLGKEILNSCENDINELAKLSVSQMIKFKGIGEAKAITIAAALELGNRRSKFPSKNPKISSSKSVYDFMYSNFADLNIEKFYILLLKRSNQIINAKEISIGGISGTIVDPKIIFKYCIEELASSVILCHNHPSGNTKPSNADIELTNKIKQGAKLLDISLLDHLIFTNNSYFSFADEGLI
ncbi:MAG: DNA repair protein RadC [Bacteroidota bacterium]|nr:DNA repair protein RadC [Bacteroidota bacterium]